MKQQKIEHSFVWNRENWKISAITLEKRAVCVDFIQEVSAATVEAFYRKWPLKRRTGGLSEEEEQQMECEMPLNCHFRIEGTINGKPAQPVECAYQYWEPEYLLRMQEGLAGEAREVKGAEEVEEAEEAMEVPEALDAEVRFDYQDTELEALLTPEQRNGESAWTLVRARFFRKSGESVKSVRITLKPKTLWRTCAYFETGQGKERQEILFTDPGSGQDYKVTVLRTEPYHMDEEIVLPGEAAKAELPRYACQMHYQIEPDIADTYENGIMIQDSTPSDEFRWKTEHGAAAVAVIGGADGPTSIWVAGKVSQPQLRPQTHTAMSSMHHQPVDEVKWQVRCRTEFGETLELGELLAVHRPNT